MVVVNRRAGRNAERVDAAHVAQDTLTDVMRMILEDETLDWLETAADTRGWK